VIPTFNRSGLLRHAIESVLDQSLSDIEILVSDNASTDDTAAVTASFGDPRVHYCPLESNLGMIANLDRCLTLGHAPYVSIFHDDDLMRPHNLASKVAVLDDHADVVFVHSAFSYVDGAGDVTRDWMAWGRPISPFESPATFIRRVFRAGSRVSPSGTLIRRRLIRQVHHELEDQSANDVGLWLRLARHGSVAYLDEPLIALRRHSGSLTVTSGMRTMSDAGGYTPTFETTAQIRLVLDRFAARFPGDPVPARELRSLARRSTRTRLAAVISNRTGTNPSRADLVRLFTEASRIEPTLAFSADGVELLVKMVLGTGAASAVQRARPALRSARSRVRAATDQS
jgi:hypothetical protein